MVLLFVFGLTAVHAQEPMVRAKLQLPDTLWTGQKVTLVVELLAPGYFSGAAAFDLPDAPGLILLPPTEHPVVSGETIGDTYYVIQRHELAVYPASAGPHTIPPITVRFAFKRTPLDHDDVAATVTTKALTLTVATPPGAESLGQVISARKLEVTETWEPDPAKTKPKTGDAFTRTITFTAPEVPGMVFPPFPAGKIAGLKLYPKSPALLDHDERGAFAGGRRDTIVYVCERPGRFTVPAVRLTWWDLDARKLRIVDLPARTFEVRPNPALSPTAAATPGVAETAAWHWRQLAGFSVLAALLVAMAASTRVRHACQRFVAPLRPVHLASLNPGED